MNTNQISVGSKVAWKIGRNVRLTGRVLDVRNHQSAACAETHVPVNRAGDVHWLLPTDLEAVG